MKSWTKIHCILSFPLYNGMHVLFINFLLCHFSLVYWHRLSSWYLFKDTILFSSYTILLYHFVFPTKTPTKTPFELTFLWDYVVFQCLNKCVKTGFRFMAKLLIANWTHFSPCLILKVCIINIFQQLEYSGLKFRQLGVCVIFIKKQSPISFKAFFASSMIL